MPLNLLNHAVPKYIGPDKVYIIWFLLYKTCFDLSAENPFLACLPYEPIEIVVGFNSLIRTAVFACYFCSLPYSVSVSQQ